MYVRKWVFTTGNPLWNWQWEAFTNIVVVYHLFFPFTAVMMSDNH